MILSENRNPLFRLAPDAKQNGAGGSRAVSKHQEIRKRSALPDQRRRRIDRRGVELPAQAQFHIVRCDVVEREWSVGGVGYLIE
jgi:hypothetical protein